MVGKEVAVEYEELHWTSLEAVSSALCKEDLIFFLACLEANM
jgi:hypothetical protein